jgi:hypothetical protein
MDHALTPRIAFRLLRKVNLAESKAFQALLNPPASLKENGSTPLSVVDGL